MHWYTRIARVGSCFALSFLAAGASAETVRGELTEEDTVDDLRSTYADTFEVDLEANEMLVVDLLSDDFDAYLIIIAPDGTRYTNDDYRWGQNFNTNSHLSVYSQEAGEWTITATSLSEGDEGDYTLEYGAVQVETFLEVEGELTEDDSRSVKAGEYYDAHVIAVEVDQVLLISLDSEDFDTYLTVYMPDGTIVTNDDSVGLNAQIVVTSAEQGEVKIIATSAGREEVGDYQLTVQRAVQNAE